MNKKLLAGLATGVFLVGMVGLANATIINTNTGLNSPETTITFDELSLSDNTVVTDQYSSFGVTFTPNLYQTPQDNSGFANFDDDFLGNFTPVVNPFDINFLSDQTNVAFALVSNPATTIFSTYLDGTLLETSSFATTYDSPTNWYQFSGYSFDQISISVSSSLMLIDNMELGSAPVPEPATMLLFGTGLVGLVGSRIRKKKKH